jgi:hypothetical protein
MDNTYITTIKIKLNKNPQFKKLELPLKIGTLSFMKITSQSTKPILKLIQ